MVVGFGDTDLRGAELLIFGCAYPASGCCSTSCGWSDPFVEVRFDSGSSKSAMTLCPAGIWGRKRACLYTAEDARSKRTLYKFVNNLDKQISNRKIKLLL